MGDPLTEFPVTIDIPVVWGEMDALQHVNNIVYFRYFESARMAYFEEIGALAIMRESGIGPILASIRCDYKFPLTYPDRVDVGARIRDVEADRFLMQYVAVSRRAERVAARGEGLIVSYDYHAGRKCPLPSLLRERIDALENRV